MKLKNIFTRWRVIVLLAFLFLSLLAIKPQVFGNDGVTIRSVLPNSSAALAGIENPTAHLSPLAKEHITAINNQKIKDLKEYNTILSTLKANETVRIQTNKGDYRLITKQDAQLGLRVANAPSSNLRKGLDLEGGTRVLLQPQEELSQEDMDSLIANLGERLNVYGLSDITIREAADLSGEKFILVELAGVTQEEVKDLLGKQGKFEAKIGNETVFRGGKDDITYVCRSATCAGIDTSQGGCAGSAGEYFCRFGFQITLTPEAAQRQADVTSTIPLSAENNQYLAEPITLYLDDQQVDQLNLGRELKGSASTNIQISGSGTGRTQEEAVTNSLQNMKRLQTILLTGSLPAKLDVVKMDTISPSLGADFITNMVFVGALALLSVIILISIRYRTPKVVVPMALAVISEMILILGFAAFFGWNLDIAAIAGIIIVAGTGVDHFIIITDETVKQETSDWKKKIKRAMFIVMGAYLTTLAGMIPLWFAGAGLLKGFAFTTIVGISFGVLIVRPAYATVLEELEL